MGFGYQDLGCYVSIFAKCRRLSGGGWTHPENNGWRFSSTHESDFLVLHFGHLTPCSEPIDFILVPQSHNGLLLFFESTIFIASRWIIFSYSRPIHSKESPSFIHWASKFIFPDSEKARYLPLITTCPPFNVSLVWTVTVVVAVSYTHLTLPTKA